MLKKILKRRETEPKHRAQAGADLSTVSGAIFVCQGKILPPWHPGETENRFIIGRGLVLAPDFLTCGGLPTSRRGPRMTAEPHGLRRPEAGTEGIRQSERPAEEFVRTSRSPAQEREEIRKEDLTSPQNLFITTYVAPYPLPAPKSLFIQAAVTLQTVRACQYQTAGLTQLSASANCHLFGIVYFWEG